MTDWDEVIAEARRREEAKQKEEEDRKYRASTAKEEKARVARQGKPSVYDSNRTFHVGGYGDITARQAVEVFVGGRAGRELERDRFGFEYGVDQTPDLTRLRQGELSDAQWTRMFVYEGSALPQQWRDDDGKITNSTRARAREIDRNIQAILSLHPELQSDNGGSTLLTLAMEPYLADRLRGMDRARTWLEMRAEVVRLVNMEDAYEARHWDAMLPGQQDALRNAGYKPVAERQALEVHTAGISAIPKLAPGWGPLGTVGEYLGADAAYDKLQGYASNLGGDALGAMTVGTNFINTAYRMISYDSQAKSGHGGSWDHWKEQWDQAWEGERFFDLEAKEEARQIVGSSENYGFVARIAAGDSVEEIAADVADLGTTEYADTVQALNRALADKRTQAAVAVLNRGKISFGRDFAQEIIGLGGMSDKEMEGTTYRLASGGADMFWVLATDPILLSGRGAKLARGTYRGIGSIVGKAGSEERFWDQAQRIYRMLSVDNARALSTSVSDLRGGAAIADVSAPNYWTRLHKLPLDGTQQIMVALADHMQAFKMGDKAALMAWNKAYPRARGMLHTFKEYVDATVPTLPNGLPEYETNLQTAAKFLSTAPGKQGIDDAVDFAEDMSGLYALQAGRWTSILDDKTMIPHLSKLGAYRVQSKLNLVKSIDWVHERSLEVIKSFHPDDYENAAKTVADLSEGLHSGAMEHLSDELHVLRQRLQAAGLDAATVQRGVDRSAMWALDIPIREGELPAHAIMRAAHMADEPEEMARILDGWKRVLAEATGDERAAEEFMAEATSRYRAAMGLPSREADNLGVFHRNLDLDTALSEARSFGTDQGVATARREYERSLVQKGDSPEVIDDALNAFDMLAAEQRASAAFDAADAVADKGFRISQLAVLPIAHAALHGTAAVARFFEYLPKTPYLMLNDASTPETLEQLLAYNIRGKRAAELYDAFMRAGEGGRRAVLRDIYSEMFGRMRILKDPKHQEFVERWMNAGTQRYALADTIEGPSGLAHVGHLPQAHYSPVVAIPSYREIHANIKRGFLLDYLWGYGHKYVGVNSDLATSFMNTWRAAVVLRPAMIPRAGGEEFFSQNMRWGFDYGIRQGIIARFHRIDPELKARSGLNDILHVDAAEGVLGKGRKRFRNAIGAVGGRILDDISPATRAAMGEDVYHAHSMAKLSRTVRRGFDDTSGVKAGYVPMAEVGPGAHDLRGPFSVDWLDAETGEVVMFNLKPSREWTTMTEHDEFYRRYLSQKFSHYSYDELGREGIDAIQTYVDPDSRARIGSVLRDRIDQSQIRSVEEERLRLASAEDRIRAAMLPDTVFVPGSDLDQVVHARSVFADLSDLDRLEIKNWIDQHQDLVKAAPVDIDMSREGVAAIARGFGWNKSEVGTKVEELALTLGYNDFNALLVNGPTPFARPMGYLDSLTQPDALYRGTSSLSRFDDIFTPRATFDSMEDWLDPHQHSGPGIYVTGSGHDAESYIAGDRAGGHPKVTRLRWRSGTPGKLIPYNDVEIAPEMAHQVDNMLDELIAGSTQRDVGLALTTIRNEELDLNAARSLLDDLDMPPQTAEAVLAVVEDGIPPRGYIAGHATQDVIQQGYDDYLMIRRKLDEAGLIEATPENTVTGFYNGAYRRHVVDHFTKQGYRGVADHQPFLVGDMVNTVDESDWVTTAAYWHPGDLEVVEEIPWASTIANAVASERARQSALNVSLAVDNLDVAMDLARTNARAVAWRPDRQHLLARMDHTAVGGIPAGKIRVQVPMIPQSTARAVLDLVANQSGTGEELLTSGVPHIAGLSAQVDRAQMMGRIGNPSTRQYVEKVLDRIEAMGPDLPDNVGTHLATWDPETARLAVERLKGGLRAVGVDDDLVELVHLGYIDLTRPEWENLAATGLQAYSPTPRAPRQVLAAEGNMGQLEAEAQQISDMRLGNAPGLRGRPGDFDASIRLINDNTVLERALSAPVDDLRWQAADITDANRAWLVQWDDRWTAAKGTRRPVAARSDEDYITHLRMALDAGELERTAVPAGIRQYLDPPVPGAEPTTRWAIQDGRTGYEGVDNMVEQMVQDIRASFIGKDGHVLHGITRPVADGNYRQPLHLQGRDLGVLPHAVVGPILEKPRTLTPAQESRRAVGEGFQGVTDWGMEKIGKGISWMARHPIWRENFAKNYIESTQVFRAMMTDSVTRSIARAHVDDIERASDELMELTAMWQDAGKGYRLDDYDVLSYLAEKERYVPNRKLITYEDHGTGKLVPVKRTEWDDHEKAILKWWRQDENARDTAIRAATERATVQTVPFIDDHRIRSQWADTIRNIIPFWFAEETFYKRWARTFIHSPESLRRITLSHQAMNSVGWLQTNEYGEEVFVYPGADKLAPALAKVLEMLPTDSKWTVPVSVAMTGQLKYAAPGFDRIGLPSAGPMVAVPLRLLRAIQPELAMPIEEKLLGERGVGRSLPEQLLPSTAYRFYDFFTVRDEELTANVVGAMIMMEANHPEDVPEPDASPAERDAYIERLRNNARIMLLSKVVLGSILPASPQYDFDPDGLSAEFRSYLQAGIPIEQAAADFLLDHPEATAYTIFATETSSKAPTDPTEAVYEEILGNEDFYRDNRAAPWLLPAGEPTDAFDRQAWYELLANKIRVRKSDTQFYEDLKFAEAADRYFDTKANVEDAKLGASTAERQRIDQWWAQWKDEYLSTHAIFKQKIEGGGSEAEREDVLANVLEATADPAAPDVPQKPLIREMVLRYDELKEDLLANGGSTSVAERTRKALRYDYLQWAEDYAAGHPTARIFFQRILLPMVDTTGGYAADLEDREAGAA